MNAAWRAVFLILTAAAGQGQPIRLHPDNPHYFLFRGEPAVLVTSAEHYGAVLNPDFDYATYLKVLEASGFNLTRAVNGNYLEGTDTTMIPWAGAQNTLCPRPGRYLAPWARSTTPGYFNGGNRFDLAHWDTAYFARLKDFVRQAAARGVVVEINANYVMYGFRRAGWELNPMNAINNVNGVGSVPHNFVNTLLDSTIVRTQEALLRKTLFELNEFDNVYYEICDEPYVSGAPREFTDAWQERLLDVFVETERTLPKRHMIAWNFVNAPAQIANPRPEVSVYNFHYAFPPDVVAANYSHNRALAFDETHEGTVARDRRREAWAFLMAGGAVYNNLDWSFALDDPTGTGKVVQPGGRINGEEVRRYLSVLKNFIDSLDFVRMRPGAEFVRSVSDPAVRTWALSNPGRAYAVYFMGGAGIRVNLDLPPGRYHAEWVEPRTGRVAKRETAAAQMESPAYAEDIALRIALEKGNP